MRSEIKMSPASSYPAVRAPIPTHVVLIVILNVSLSFIAPVGAFASSRLVDALQLAELNDSSLSEGSSEGSSAGSFEDESSATKSRSWTSSAEKSRTIQNPTAALFKSMVVPGWGQVGNKQYIKAGFVIGLESFLFLKWLRFRRKTADARSAFEDAATSDPNRTVLFNRFQGTRNDRNLYAWLTGTAIFVSMFDAFVDAHLSGFPNAEDEVGISIVPFPGSVEERTIWGAQIRYSF